MPAVNTDEGTILEALNDKLDRDANNLDASTTNFDVVIDYQVPTAENNYTWYRRYASGWVEQGGALQTPTDALITIIMPVTMTDTNYTLLLTRTWSGSNTTTTNNGGLLTCNKTTTTFQCWGKYYDSIVDNWQVCGMAAATV